MQYKCVNMPVVGTSAKTKTEEVIAAYEKLIMEYASQGWEYVGTDTMTTVRSNGCLGGLMGSATTSENYKVLIFRKP